MKKLFLLLVLTIFISCKKEKKADTPLVINNKKITLKHAKGFTVTKNSDYTILTINSPWANAKTTYKYALIPKEKAPSITLNASDYEGLIITPVNKAIATSTTHIGAIDALNAENTLIGFPNTNFISSKKIRKRITDGFIKDIGKNEDLNTELLIQLNPDVIFAFSVSAANKSLQTLKNTKTPILYIGEWTEASPLAKAEWLKVFGLLFEKEKQADSIFNTIENNYLKAKLLAKKATTKPTVLSGAMYKDIWYLPTGTSSESILFKNSNTNYLWQETTGSGSLELNFETVFTRAKNADFWFNPFSIMTYEGLRKNNHHYTKFSAYKNKKIYSFAGTKGETGGLLYYELGTLRPDIVLKDLIKICHPQLLPEHELFFYKQLQ